MTPKEKQMLVRNVGVIVFWVGTGILASHFGGVVGLGVCLIVCGIIQVIPRK
jgi:hypothetical protein